MVNIFEFINTYKTYITQILVVKPSSKEVTIELILAESYGCNVWCLSDLIL